MEPLTIDERLRRIEELLGLQSRNLEAWIVAPNIDSEHGRTLDYWGPFPSRQEAIESSLFRPQFGCSIVELPAA